MSDGLRDPAEAALRVVSGLVGDRIARVVYREIKYEPGGPEYRVSEQRHSLDYGLELHLGSGRVVSFIWKWPVSYYLGVLKGTLESELSGDHAVWDASSDSPWPDLLEREIRAAHLAWFESRESAGHFPLTAKLVIEPGASIYVTLGVQDEADDHIAVLFSDDEARLQHRFFSASGPCEWMD